MPTNQKNKEITRLILFMLAAIALGLILHQCLQKPAPKPAQTPMLVDPSPTVKPPKNDPVVPLVKPIPVIKLKPTAPVIKTRHIEPELVAISVKPEKMEEVVYAPPEEMIEVTDKPRQRSDCFLVRFFQDLANFYGN